MQAPIFLAGFMHLAHKAIGDTLTSKWLMPEEYITLSKLPEKMSGPQAYVLLTLMQGPLKNKIPHFQEYITNANIDLCAITETWLKPDNDDIAKAFPPLGYTILSWPRQDGWRGGGITFVSKSHINIEEDKDKAEYQTMELLHLSVKVKCLVLSLYTVYRIPNTSVVTFCDEMANVLENNIVSDRGETILIGDFNIHMDDPEDLDTITFNDFLDSLDFINLVNFGTHI